MLQYNVTVRCYNKMLQYTVCYDKVCYNTSFYDLIFFIMLVLTQADLQYFRLNKIQSYDLDEEISDQRICKL